MLDHRNLRCAEQGADLRHGVGYEVTTATILAMGREGISDFAAFRTRYLVTSGEVGSRAWSQRDRADDRSVVAGSQCRRNKADCLCNTLRSPLFVTII